MGMSKKSRNANFWKKKRRRPNVEQSYLEKATHALDEFILFYRNLKKSFFPVGNVFPYHGDFLLNTKMVRMVPRNILYNVDLKICDSKRGFGMKS